MVLQPAVQESAQELCVHCGTRPVTNRKNAKVCQSCFTFGIALLLGEHKVLPMEARILPIGKTAKIFGDGWPDFALKCYSTVLVHGGL